jgi:fatty-acyl-CoA synthase
MKAGSHSRFRGLADVESLEKVPLEDRIGHLRSTFDIFCRTAERFPDRPALHFIPGGTAAEEPRTLTYQEFVGRIRQAANLFAELGVGSDDVVSYLLPNLPETHFTLWGGEAAGIVNPINPMLEPRAIIDIAAAVGTRVLVAPGPDLSEEIWSKVELLRPHLPNLRAVLQVGGPGDEAGGVLDFDAATSAQPADRLAFDRRIDPRDTAAFFHTGGTTGSPKLARHAHAGQIYNAWVIADLAELGPEDVLLCGLPLFHNNAVIVTGLAPFFAGSSAVLLSPGGYRNPNVLPEFWRTVERYRATFFSAVPTVYAALLQVPAEGCDVSSLRYALCGAAPLPREVFRAFEERTGVRILEGYGLTEGTCASAVNPPYGERRIGSVGVRIPYQEMKTVRLDQEGNHVGDCDPNEIGAVVIRGPNVFTGYLKESDNRGVFLDGGWFVTGDLGRRDEDGYFWLTGRRKELIIRGGHNIDPAVIEEALVSHPEVELAAAVGRPDPHAGELPVAFVSLVAGARASADELMEFAREHIGERAAVPKAIHVTDELPLTAVGKIFKPRLRWEATRIALEEALAPLRGEGAEVAVEVGPDEVHGTLARVRVSHPTGTEFVKRAEEILGAYPVAFEIEYP